MSSTVANDKFGEIWPDLADADASDIEWSGSQTGILWQTADESWWLCVLVLESYPPQCDTPLVLGNADWLEAEFGATLQDMPNGDRVGGVSVSLEGVFHPSNRVFELTTRT